MESKVHHTSGDVSGRRVKGTHFAPCHNYEPTQNPFIALQFSFNTQCSPLPGLPRLPRPRLLSSTILSSSSVLPVPGPPLINTPLHGKFDCSFRYYLRLLLSWGPHCTCWWAGGRRGAGEPRGTATRAPGTGRRRGRGRGHGRGGEPPGVGTMVAVFGC